MNTNQSPDTLHSFSQFLKETLGDLLRPEATTFLGMLTDDVVMEFPYAPPGGVHRVEGLAALTEYAAGLADILHIDSVNLEAFHHTAQSNVVVLEFVGKGTGVQTGRSYIQSYISVITLRDGLISHYRDYWNPLVAIETMGGSEAINAAVQGK
ncbi:nuclear transport factor 2 family protein [bacterium]|nr:MAG: nuclear transport factor 2 family protein [bacterium]